ncbi:hypothetical protein ACGF07_31430 [Kitasatospora sp. NPDC048194]|uniref:hypothetical protein n=1 Tax=Kitasatospora sp. NPDC048194 TaxID=3364045 RepID=UPI0037226CF6
MIGEKLGIADELQPVNVSSIGFFPYHYLVENDFYYPSWRYINHTVEPSKKSKRLEFGDPLSERFEDYVNRLCYELSDTEAQTLEDCQKDLADTGDKLISLYEQTFKKITSSKLEDAGVETKIDYIASYKLMQWAGDELKLDGDVLKDLWSYLKEAPQSAKPLVPLLTQYLNGLLPVAGLINTLNAATWKLGKVRRNLDKPGEENGGLYAQDEDGKYWVPRFTVDKKPDTIHEELGNSGNKVTITAKFTDFNGSKSSLQVEGQAGGTVSLPSLFSVSAKGSAKYSLHQLNSQASSCEMAVEYSGFTTVTFSPSDFVSGRGWFTTAEIKDAVNYGDNDSVSGWVLKPYPRDGGITYPSYLAISQFPTIRVTYTSGSLSTKVQKWQTGTKVEVRLLGIPLAETSHDYQVTKIESHGENQGFTLTLGPTLHDDLLKQDRRAFVIGAGVKKIEI